jgi:hypothetical protein
MRIYALENSSFARQCARNQAAHGCQFLTPKKLKTSFPPVLIHSFLRQKPLLVNERRSQKEEFTAAFPKMYNRCICANEACLNLKKNIVCLSHVFSISKKKIGTKTFRSNCVFTYSKIIQRTRFGCITIPHYFAR